MTRGAAWALVPVKELDASKGRLAGVLDPAARRALSLAMLADVLDALAEVPALDGVALISRDAGIVEAARARGLRLIPETAMGLNSAVAEAARVLAAEGCARLLVLPADLPLADASEIGQILTAQRAAPGLALVPDRKGLGTNALLCAPPQAISPCFGEDSFARHQAAAREAGIDTRVLRLPGLGLDIDTPEDLRALMETPGSTRSHAVLRVEQTVVPACAAGDRP